MIKNNFKFRSDCFGAIANPHINFLKQGAKLAPSLVSRY